MQRNETLPQGEKPKSRGYREKYAPHHLHHNNRDGSYWYKNSYNKQKRKWDPHREKLVTSSEGDKFKQIKILENKK